MRRAFSLIFFGMIILGVNDFAFAQKLAILYTGQSHANLYPCHCPIEPFGGVSRRASKIKELRKQFSGLLLLDCGSFFAGGVQDETNQTPEIQKARTQLYLKTLKLMGYDALTIGSDEFNFGKEFLEAQINETKIPFLSSNIKLKGSKEFIIKEIAGIKIGIIGVSSQLGNIPAGLQISDSQLSLQESVDKLKSKKVDLIVVLSSLGEVKDRQLIENVKGIDVLVGAGPFTSYDKFTKIDSTILLRSVWQARKLGKLEMDFKDKKIENFSVEQVPLGADVSDDKEIKSMLPVCFSDYDCLKPQYVGTCQNPGKKEASCSFEKIKKLVLLIVKPRSCRTCFTGFAINNIKRVIPNIEIQYADYEEASSKKLIEDLGINMLPAYILTSDIEKDRNFSLAKGFLTKKDNYYFFKPYFTGVSYFVGRPLKESAVDLFILLHAKQSDKVLEIIKALKNKMAKKIDLNIRFLIIEDSVKGFKSPGGLAEIEEAKKAVCVEKYSSNILWDYLICRSQDIEGSQDKCLSSLKLDAAKIKQCATSLEADNLLRKNIRLNQELQVSDWPLILLNNQEVFGLNPATTVEELKAIIEGKSLINPAPRA